MLRQTNARKDRAALLAMVIGETADIGTGRFTRIDDHRGEPRYLVYGRKMNLGRALVQTR